MDPTTFTYPKPTLCQWLSILIWTILLIGVVVLLVLGPGMHGAFNKSGIFILLGVGGLFLIGVSFICYYLGFDAINSCCFGPDMESIETVHMEGPKLQQNPSKLNQANNVNKMMSLNNGTKSFTDPISMEYTMNVRTMSLNSKVYRKFTTPPEDGQVTVSSLKEDSTYGLSKTPSVVQDISDISDHFFSPGTLQPRSQHRYERQYGDQPHLQHREYHQQQTPTQPHQQQVIQLHHQPQNNPQTQLFQTQNHSPPEHHLQTTKPQNHYQPEHHLQTTKPQTHSQADHVQPHPTPQQLQTNEKVTNHQPSPQKLLKQQHEGQSNWFFGENEENDEIISCSNDSVVFFDNNKRLNFEEDLANCFRASTNAKDRAPTMARTRPNVVGVVRNISENISDIPEPFVYVTPDKHKEKLEDDLKIEAFP